MTPPMKQAIPILCAALLLGGCVTINIYFPAAAAEKAADRIIDEVWQTQKPGEKGSGAPADKAQPRKE